MITLDDIVASRERVEQGHAWEQGHVPGLPSQAVSAAGLGQSALLTQQTLCLYSVRLHLLPALDMACE